MGSHGDEKGVKLKLIACLHPVILDFVVRIYYLAYEVPLSSASFYRQKFGLNQNSEGEEKN